MFIRIILGKSAKSYILFFFNSEITLNENLSTIEGLVIKQTNTNSYHYNKL